MVGQTYALMAVQGGHTTVPRRAFGTEADENVFRDLLASYVNHEPQDTTVLTAAASRPSPLSGPAAAPGELAVAFALDEAEAATVARRLLAQRKRTWTWVSGIAAVALFVAGLSVTSPGGSAKLAGTLIGWGLPVVLFVFFFGTFGRSIGARALGRRLWARGEETVAYFTEQVIRALQGHTSAEADWSYFSGATLAGDAYVLTTRTGDHWVTPRRAFGSEAAEKRYRELVTAHVRAVSASPTWPA
jgi:hypothetical protein